MFRILRRDYDITSDAVFVDSDNVVTEDFLKHHEELRHNGVYGILDYERWSGKAARLFLERSTLKDRERKIFMYKVHEPKNYLRGGPPFFWGPKQAIYLRTLPAEDLVNGLDSALAHVTPCIRNLLIDESLLGVMAWLAGMNYIPWTVASHHFHHGSGQRTDKHLIAKAHAQFAKGLWHVFRKKEFLLYYLKYKAITLREGIEI
jgi:hypothetical protein